LCALTEHFGRRVARVLEAKSGHRHEGTSP
jgi:hypothetical protein